MTAGAVRAVLFDIDGTLIDSGGAGAESWRRAFVELYDVPADIGAYTDSGMTDPEVGRLTFAAVVGHEPSAEELAEVMRVRAKHLPDAVAESAKYRVLPGVEPLLRRLEDEGVVLGLTTGGTEEAGRIKLARGDLNRFFAFGGFGSDSDDRDELTRVAVARAAERVGAPLGRENALAVGDTPHDIDSARAAGVASVGVASGKFSRDQLAAAHADHVLGSLEEPFPRMKVGVDLGGTKILALAVDDDHAILGRARHPTPTAGGPPDVAAAVAAAAREAAGGRELTGVGVGSPGAIDAEAGTVTSAKNLPGWGGTFALGPALAQELGVPVALGNDVSCAVQAEFSLGAGEPYDSLLGVWWGTGVGGGLVLDGKLWLGRGAAGELGHIVVKQDGARCPCGRRGCLEAYAGRLAMEQRARHEVEQGVKTKLFSIMEKEGKPRLTSGVWERALDREDKLAVELVERALEALGTGLASVVNLLDLEAIVVGGGMGERLGERYRDRLVEEMHPHLFSDGRPPALHATALPGDGGALGAAMLVP